MSLFIALDVTFMITNATPWPFFIVNPLLSPQGLIYFKHIGGEAYLEKGLLFGRGPNRVSKRACFDAKA